MTNNDGLEALRRIEQSTVSTYVYAIDDVPMSMSCDIKIRYETPRGARKSDSCPKPDEMDYDNPAVVVFKYLGLDDPSMEIEDMRPVPTVVENGVITQLDYEKMRSRLGVGTQADGEGEGDGG